MRSRLGLGRALLWLALTPLHAWAQTPTPPPDPPSPFSPLTFNLGLEGFYEYNGNRPPNRVIVLRAYDTLGNSFGLQQASFVMESAPDRKASHPFGLRLDLQFGQATETLQASAANEPRPNVYRHIWQAYGSYVFPGSKTVRLDFGKFASNLGYETNYAKDNGSFSRAYLFNFLPFYHAGVRVTAALSDRVTVMYVLSNGTQQTEDFNNPKSNQAVVVLTPAKTVSWTVNYYAGQEQPDNGQPNGPNGWFRVFDTYVTYTPTSKISVGADVNHTTNQVQSTDTPRVLNGFGGYGRYQVAKRQAIAARYEYLRDDGLFGGVKQNLQETTVTFEQKVGDGFLLRAEFRRDWSNTDFFPGPAAGELRRAQNTGLVGLIWWMGGKTGVW